MTVIAAGSTCGGQLDFDSGVWPAGTAIYFDWIMSQENCGATPAIVITLGNGQTIYKPMPG